MKNKTLSQIEGIIQSKSVAIVGASGSPGKVGRMFLDRYIEAGFETIYPVNPKEKEILGYQAYPSVSDIPESLDLVHILLPPQAVRRVVEACFNKGVKGIIVTSAGFGFESEAAKIEEQNLVNQARARGIRMVGPNCIGIYCPETRLPFPLGQPMKEGPIGIVSQSGSFADLLTKIATSNHINFSKVISCGNDADLNAIDFLEYLGEDRQTEVIIAYLEGIKDGRRFVSLAKNISKTKPIIVWKCGNTQAGTKAAASHTGALTGTGEVWEGVLDAAGCIPVHSLEEALDCLYMCTTQPIPRGKKVAVVTGPGGPSVGVMDTLTEMNMDIAQFTPDTIEKIRRIIPPFGSSAENPVDLSIAAIEMPQMYGEVIKHLEHDDGVDMILVIGLGGEHFCETIIEASKTIRKPIAVTVIYPPEEVALDFKMLLKNNIPVYTDARRAANALAKYAAYGAFKRS